MSLTALPLSVNRAALYDEIIMCAICSIHKLIDILDGCYHDPFRDCNWHKVKHIPNRIKSNWIM